MCFEVTLFVILETMKRIGRKVLKAVLVGICLGGLCGACTARQEIHITGSVRHADGALLVCRRSVGGMFNSQTFDTLKLQKDSTFAMTLPGGEYERVQFYLYGKKKMGSILIKEGTMRIELDGWAEKSMNVTEGRDEKTARVAEILEQLYEDVFAVRMSKDDRWQITRDTVAASVRRKLMNYALLLENEVEGVDEDLHAKVCQDIRMQLLLAFQNQMMATVFRSTETTKQEWLAQLDSMTAFCSINHPCSPFSLSFYDVAINDTGIRYYTRGEQKPDGVEKGVQLAFYDFTHRLTGKAQEAALAQLFLEDESKQRYNPQLLSLVDEFYRLYPESVWMQWVNRAVAKNHIFNETAIPADINFPDVSLAKTLKEVIDRYKGKVIFMDIWATWCGPCRESFAHIGKLQEYAAANDVVLLYLSIDRLEDDEKWRKMAVHYKLKGEHVRKQEAFHQDIYDTFGHKGALSIPRCVIFDKQGKIRFSKAASPEQWDSLKEQLQEAAQ